MNKCGCGVGGGFGKKDKKDLAKKNVRPTARGKEGPDWNKTEPRKSANKYIEGRGGIQMVVTIYKLKGRDKESGARGKSWAAKLQIVKINQKGKKERKMGS